LYILQEMATRDSPFLFGEPEEIIIDDSGILKIRGPYYPVQDPFMPPPLQGPSVPLNNEFEGLPLFIKHKILREHRYMCTQDPGRKALMTELKLMKMLHKERKRVFGNHPDGEKYHVLRASNISMMGRIIRIIMEFDDGQDY
jgi:hypothetical protein